MLARGEREAMVMAPPSMRDSAGSPCFHGCLAFLHRQFPTTVSTLTSPRSVSPQSAAALAAPQSLNSSSQPLSLPGDPRSCPHMYGCGKDCLILIPFRLPQISCFTLSLKCFSSDNCSDVGTGLLLQFPHLPRIGPVQ